MRAALCESRFQELEFGLDGGGLKAVHRNAGTTGNNAEESEANAISCQNTERQRSKNCAG